MTIVDATGSSTVSARKRRADSRAQKSARRHSFFVRFLRIALPGLGLLVLAGMIGLVILFNILSGIGGAGVTLTSDGLVMHKPELSGNDGDRSYKVSAVRAIQRLSDPRVIDLETIRAEIDLGADQSAKITALNGTYDNAAETLRLYDGIQLEWSEGYAVDLREVAIDLKTGALTTDDPLIIRSDRGSIEAGQLRYVKRTA
ncbi:LPS export ABC transporter periplasmic protein LptC [Roseibium hamelinense]|uniref:LPS export ABC transporter periplasmic protein LptC n=1 Tax=Roseibium hamelinense TaxID=150831 RepID=UPI001AD9483B|nr:LPS export ABC transporter periplasmic protein LptC [Roseibium hamelinense]